MRVMLAEWFGYGDGQELLVKLPLAYTYAHVHLVLLVRVHLCCLYSFVPNVWGADRGWCRFQSEAVGLTPSFSCVTVRRVTWSFRLLLL